MRQTDDPPRQTSPWGTAPRRSRASGWRFALLLLVFVAVLLGVALFVEPGVLDGSVAWREARWMQITQLTVIFVAAAAWMSRFGDRLAVVLRNAAIWGGVALMILAIYTYRSEFGMVGNRMAATLLPGRGVPIDDRTVSFVIANDEHFWIDATANAKPVRFLFDTGASGIVLSKPDAQRLGFALDTLEFDTAFETANGTTYGARVRLDRLRIGPIVLDEVDAWVNEGEMHASLLGMRFLQRMTKVEISGDTLTLRH